MNFLPAKNLRRPLFFALLSGIFCPVSGLEAALVQYGFDFTSGSVESNGGTVSNDGTGPFNAVIMRGDGGTYTDDIPPAANRQFTTGIGSLRPDSGAVRTGSGAFAGEAVATNSEVAAAGGLTLEAWVKGGNNGVILTVAGAYGIMGTADGYRMVNGANIISFVASAPADRSVWNHVAAVYSNPLQDGNNLTVTMRLYINGTFSAELLTTLPFDLARGIGVGDHPLFPNGGDFFDGLIYEPRVSLGALSPESFTYTGVAQGDADQDGIPDAYETLNGLDPAVDDSLLDLDKDGVSNIEEYRRGLQANNPDTDGDGLQDGVETNTGIFVSAADTGTSPLKADTDGDGLLDGVETNTGIFAGAANTGSNPLVADTDGDGFSDSAEVAAGFDPSLATSTPESAATIRTAVEFTFHAAAGINYRIEGSTNLQSWTILEPFVTGTGGPVSRLYSTATQPVRYFRAVRN